MGGERAGQQRFGFGAVPGAVAEADGVVQPLAGQIDPVVVGEEAEVDERMRLLERREPRQQPAYREGADCGHREDFAQPAVLELAEYPADAAEGVFKHRQQRQPFVGERQAARQAAEQRHAESLLQALHVLAHCGLRHVQLVGGAGEAQLAGRGLEGAQGVQGEVHRKAIFSRRSWTQVFLGSRLNYCRLSRRRVGAIVPTHAAIAGGC